MSSKWFAPALLLAAFTGWLTAVLFGDVTWLSATTKIIQDGFLAALKMIIAPLIFFSLIVGVLHLRSAGSMGRLGGVTVLYYLTTSGIAIVIGLVVVFFIHPWTDSPPLTDVPVVEAQLINTQDGSVWALVGGIVTAMLSNPFTALAELNILGILTSALLFGLAAAWVLPKDSPWPDMLQQITEVIFRVAVWILTLLPLGMFAIAFQLTDRIDFSTLVSLGQFAAVVFGATAFHGLIVLPLLAWLLTGTPPQRLFPAIAQPLLTAFVTSSSAATLPLSMRAAEEKLHVHRDTAAFVLPLGATVNMDGTALFEGVAVIFLAYMFSVPLTPAAIVLVFFVTMLASAGAPGIPSGSMAGLQIVLLAVGIPLEAIALLLLIERPLDTFRTAVNVQGDLIGSLVAEKYA
ncbi:MAG: dicarboxylate/amino acid:cation symporter [Pseudomonadota bacterium]